MFVEPINPEEIQKILFVFCCFLPSGLTSSNRRALHVDGAQKTDYVLPHLRQSRNSELCLTQSQYTDTGPTSRTRRSWGKCNGVDAGAYHTGFPAEAPYPTFPLINSIFSPMDYMSLICLKPSVEKNE